MQDYQVKYEIDGVLDKRFTTIFQRTYNQIQRFYKSDLCVAVIIGLLAGLTYWLLLREVS